MTRSLADVFSLQAVGPGRWAVDAGAEWKNSNGALWGGFPIGLCLRIAQAEPEARGEPLSISLTYIAALREGLLEVRTRCIRQGGSIGVWMLELRPIGSEGVCVQAMVTMAKRQASPPFAFAEMPEAPAPENLPEQENSFGTRHFGALGFERRTNETFPIQPSKDSRSLTWVRPRRAVWDKALLGMITDGSPPRAFYARGHSVMTTTLSLSVNLHASAEEVATAGRDFVLVEYEGRVGSGGASDERSSYWRRDGKLLATSEQLVWYREK